MIGSSLYTMRLRIECLALSPVSGTDDSNSLASEREAHGQDATAHTPESKVAILGSTVSRIFGEDESRIIERPRCKLEGNTVLGYIVTGLPLVPLELHSGR